MSSTSEWLAGPEATEELALALIDAKWLDFPRARSAHIGSDWKTCLVVARIGASNQRARSAIEAFRAIRKWPLYLDDGDWLVDESFAVFRFRIPEARLADAKLIREKRLTALSTDFKKTLEERNDGKSVDDLLDALQTAWRMTDESVATSSFAAMTVYETSDAEEEEEEAAAAAAAVSTVAAEAKSEECSRLAL